MTMRRATLTAAALLVALQAPALAQESGLVQPGARVRVFHHCAEKYDPGERRERVVCEEQTGTVASLSSDSLVLNVNNEGTFASIPLGSVSRLQLSKGRGGAGTRGALYGGLAGAFVGGLAGLAVCSSVEDSTNSPGACALGGALVVSIPGAAIGLMLGHSLGREGWVDIPIEGVAVSVGSAGVGIGITVQF
jgi:hypothetical protein